VKTDAIVVGAGIVGAACARELMRQGLKVTMLGRDVTGGGATAAGMGHVVVMDDSEAQFALTKRSVELWDELEAVVPVEVEFERRGTLWVAADEAEMRAVAPKLDYYRERGVQCELLDAKALYEAEPGLRPGMAGGFLVPGDSVVYAPCAAAWMAQGAARVREDAVKVGDGEVTLESGARMEAPFVVVATGAAVTKLLPRLPVKPRKGHLAITDRYVGAVRHQLVELGYLKSAHGHSTESVAFNVQPRKTGQLLIGSSRQYGVEHGEVEPHMLKKMLERAVEYLPGLERMKVIRTWTGFRAATPDKLPIVGLCPGYEKTWLATGHEGLGITTSLGTAEMLMDLMRNRQGVLDASAYRAERFEQCRV
jgi:D-hydroxyproline dehydrogenase subunit beta